MLPTELNIYKPVHFLLFVLIGYLIFTRRPYRIPIRAEIGIIALFALATESMQVLASSRDGSLSDVLIDLFGICCGLLAAAAIHFITARNRKSGPGRLVGLKAGLRPPWMADVRKTQE